MPDQNERVAQLRPQDWEHRLQVLWGWRHKPSLTTPDRDLGSVARAVLDGCAITVRALCAACGIRADFKNPGEEAKDNEGRARELFNCIYRGKRLSASCRMTIRSLCWKPSFWQTGQWLIPPTEAASITEWDKVQLQPR